MQKSSDSPSKVDKAGQSKFSKMRQKLQLKDKGHATGVHQGLDVLNEVPIASQQPTREEVPVTDKGEEVPPVEENDTRSEKIVAKKKNQSIFFNRSSPMKIVRVCKDMTPQQRELIAKSDFGDFTRMKCSKLIPELCMFLMECFDPIKCELDFGDRGSIPVTAESIVKVMGVPMGSSPVPYHLDVDATSLILDMLGIKDGVQPTITYVETLLGKEYPADDGYLRKFVIYIISSVFAPTTGTKVSPKCYPAVINTNAIRTLNWARFILDILIQTAHAKGTKNMFKACMPYLMILYVDSLVTNALDIPEDGTRCAIWTNKMIGTVTDLDTKSDGSFGALPLKDCFKRKFSLFTTNPSDVDLFIRRHLPGNQTDEVLAKYRLAVTNMCNVFEEGLASFIKSLQAPEEKGCTTEAVAQSKETIVEHRAKPKRKRTGHGSTEIVQGHDGPEKNATNDQRPVTIETYYTVCSKQEDKTRKRKTSDKEMGEHRAAKKQAHEQIDTSNSQSSDKDVVLQQIEEVTRTMELAQIGVTQNIDDSEKQQELQRTSSPQSNDNTHREASPKQPAATLQPQQVVEQSCSVRKLKGKKTVSFAVQADGVQSCAATDFMFPIEATASTQGSPQVKQMPPTVAASIVSKSPRRSPRLAKEEEQANCSHANSNSSKSSMAEDAQNLEKVTGSPDSEIQTEAERRRQELIDDCPSFSLGMDEQNSEEQACEKVLPTPSNPEETVVISSNEGSGDSLDKIYATIEMPSTTYISEKSADGSHSHTPVPEAHKKRVLKSTRAQLSPYVAYDKKSVATKFAHEVYSKVCEYGGKSEDAHNKTKIINSEKFFIYLRELADSVRPKAWLSNETCEMALHVISAEMEKQKKHVMPLRLSTKLRSATCVHDRFVKKIFKMTPECRLDHKEQVLFPVLQDLTPDLSDFNGHYYLIVLNLKAERFEVMDSLRAKGNRGLIEDSRAIIGSIKHMWSLNYVDSNINIQNWSTEHINTPMQKTSFDYGFFMLKFIELWNGRRMLVALNPDDMPDIRKLLTLKWLQWEDNITSWQEVLF